MEFFSFYFKSDRLYVRHQERNGWRFIIANKNTGRINSIDACPYVYAL